MGRRREVVVSAAQPTARVALYARVSTDEQRTKGTVETQLSKVRGRAVLEEWHVAGEYIDDGISGAVPLAARPAGRRLLEDARAGRLDTVVIYRLDRLGRKLQVIVDAQAELERCGVRLHSTGESIDTSTPAGRMIFHVLASVAEMERDVIYERTNGGRDRVAETGRWVTGPIPPGYDLDERGYLTPGADADLWAGIFGRIAHGGSSAKAEAQRLTALSVSTDARYPGGKVTSGAAVWRSSRVLDILHSPVYKGTRDFGLSDGTVSSTPCAPLVDEQTWDRVQARLSENSALNGGGRDYLLRGLVRCAGCGRTFTGWPHTNTHYYRCHAQSARYSDPTIAPCNARMLPATDMERVVWEQCRWIVLHPEEALADAQKYLRDQAAGPRTDTVAEQENLRVQIANWQLRESRQKEMCRAGIASVAETATVVREAQGHVATLEAGLAALGSVNQPAAQVLEFAVDLGLLANRLDDVERLGDRQAQRQIIECLVAGIRVTTTGDGHHKEALVQIIPNLGEPVTASVSAPASPDELVWSTSGTRRSGR